MALNLKDISGKVFAGVTALGLVISPMASTPAYAQQARPAAATATSQIDFPFSDARNVAPDMVRIVARKETEQHPTLVLFGVRREAWPELRSAIQQSSADGYPLRAVFMGPTDAPPSLEIYSKGTLVTKPTEPINPNTFSRDDLVKLIKDVYKDDGLQKIARSSPAGPSVEQ